MTPDQERLRDAYLAELWPVTRELSYGERVAKRQADWESRVMLDLRPQVPPGYAPQSPANTGDVHKSDAA